MRRAALLVVLALPAASAQAAPFAQLVRDIDGDGAADTVELHPGGELQATTRAGTGKVELGPVSSTVTLSGTISRGTPTIVVHMGHEVVVVQNRGGTTWKTLVRTRVGGVGLDGDYATDIVALPEGVFRFQTRPGFRRCDNKPALLFGERYEGGRFQRLARLPIGVPENAPVIAAKLDPNAAPDSLHYKARVASHQPGAMDAGALGIPSELDDGKPATMWREDLVASSGEGQFFTYTPRFADAKATQVRIVPGTQKGANRPHRLGIVAKNGAWHIDLPDAQKDPANSAYVADLPSPVEGCVTIVIESTYGSDRGTTSIAELAVYGEGERSGGGEAGLARVVADGRDGARGAAQALASRGAAGVAAIDGELGRTDDPAARGRLVRALMAIRDPAAGPILSRAVSQGHVAGSDLVAAIEALSGLGQAQELHDLAARSGLALEARVAAAQSLQPAVEKDRDFLIALAGHGPRELRQAVIAKLSEVPVAMLAPAAQAQQQAAAAGDLWRAITRRAHAVADERERALAALTAALPTATDYERRYRVVDGIAAIGDAAALKALTGMLASLPDDAQTAAYRQVAARAIAVNPRGEAADLLISLTRDRDPGVRLSALSAIAGITSTGAGPWHGDAGVDGVDRVIMTMLASDAWPEVRRGAAQVLGARCMRIGPAKALADAVSRDKDVDVRGDSLAGLVECKAAGTSDLLAKLWDDSKAPIDLRRRAIDLTVALADPALGQRLVGKFSQWRGAAIESEAALQLAQNAAYALGRLAPAGAAEALMAALDDSAFPEIVAAAATGLGLMGASCPASARNKLASLAGSDEQQVQTAARRAAAQCRGR